MSSVSDSERECVSVWGCVVETETKVVVEWLEATYIGVVFDGRQVTSHREGEERRQTEIRDVNTRNDVVWSREKKTTWAEWAV